jgi:hypothetical protein
MVHKAVPITIVVLLVLAVGLGYVFLFYGAIEVGEPFQVPYDDCLSVMDVKSQFISAMNAGDPEKCRGMDAERFCMAIVSKDESLCDGDQSCLAIVHDNAEECPEADFDCQALIRQDASPCEGHLPFEIDSHGECVAFSSMNGKYFTSMVAKRNCLDTVIYQVSEVSVDCNLIENADLREQCMSKFS